MSVGVAVVGLADDASVGEQRDVDVSADVQTCDDVHAMVNDRVIY